MAKNAKDVYKRQVQRLVGSLDALQGLEAGANLAGKDVYKRQARDSARNRFIRVIVKVLSFYATQRPEASKV